MFRTPFSYEGRIRRLEFGLTYLIYFFSTFLIGFLISENKENGDVITFFLYVPLVWFLTAQGSKRCHDLSNNGWFQLIPFYVLWMIFKDGEIGENQYGLNPKGIGNEESFDDQINEIGKSLES